MREMLSELIVSCARRDPKFVVLSGDHGYALFDAIRSQAPSQFINVGVMEQAMVGIAAGLAKTGFKPIVYGLSAFVPIRILEQIKLDVCNARLPVVFLGDGAGLVYSTLGVSHQSGEDVACLRPLPHIDIYSPCDENELRECFSEAIDSRRAAYIRIGKSDRGVVTPSSLKGTEAHTVVESTSPVAFVATGSLVSIAAEIAQDKNYSCISVPRIKPFSESLVQALARYEMIYVFEEHYRAGGLASAILEELSFRGLRVPHLQSISLKEQFAVACGSHQYALSEHGLSDQQLRERFSSKES